MRRLTLGLFAIALVGCGADKTSEKLGRSEQALSTGLVISAIYGGTSAGPYTNDWVEIFNRGPTAISLTGITLQYSRSDYRTWSATANQVLLSLDFAPIG